MAQPISEVSYDFSASDKSLCSVSVRCIVYGIQTRGAQRIVTPVVRRVVFSMEDITLRRTTDPYVLPGGPGSEHPCGLAATPDAFDASDVIQRCPSQVIHDLRWTLLTCIHTLVSPLMSVVSNGLFACFCTIVKNCRVTYLVHTTLASFTLG